MSGPLLAALMVLVSPAAATEPEEQTMLIDDFADADGVSALGTRWKAVSDRVMGGVSDVRAALRRDDRPHLHLSGVVRDVPASGSAGFVQVGVDLQRLDASEYTGLRLVVRGDGSTYGAHLRTPDVDRPWQSYRGRFEAPEAWTEVRIPFTDFEPHRLSAPFDSSRLTRLSLIAVDRAGPADLRIAEVSLYR